MPTFYKQNKTKNNSQGPKIKNLKGLYFESPLPLQGQGFLLYRFQTSMQQNKHYISMLFSMLLFFLIIFTLI